MVPSHRITIHRPLSWLEVKRPQKLSNAQEHVSLRQVDARAYPAPNAVAIMVTALPCSRDIIGSQLKMIGEALGDESSWVIRLGWIHVHPPSIDHHYRAFGEEFAINPVVCKDTMVQRLEDEDHNLEKKMQKRKEMRKQMALPSPSACGKQSGSMGLHRCPSLTIILI